MSDVNPLDVAHEAFARGAAQKVAEFAPLVHLIWKRKPTVVLEIGTLRGGTLWAWCQVAAADATLISVDLPDGPWGGGYTEADAETFKTFAKPGQTLHLLRADSHDPATLEQVQDILAGKTVDFAFIDGDHSYEGCKADFQDYGPFVRAGGLVAFHDILPHPQVPGCDVDQVWTEIHGRFDNTWEFTDPGDVHHAYGQWGGIGVIEL